MPCASTVTRLPARLNPTCSTRAVGRQYMGEHRTTAQSILQALWQRGCHWQNFRAAPSKGWQVAPLLCLSPCPLTFGIHGMGSLPAALQRTCDVQAVLSRCGIRAVHMVCRRAGKHTAAATGSSQVHTSSAPLSMAQVSGTASSYSSAKAVLPTCSTQHAQHANHAQAVVCRQHTTSRCSPC